MIDSRALRSHRSVVGADALGRVERADLQSGASIQVRIERTEDRSVVLVLLGELDINSMEYFEGLLADVMSQEPHWLIFDLTQASFISAQGFDAIGRCSRTTHVEVRSVTDLAPKVLSAYGHEVAVHLPPPSIRALAKSRHTQVVRVTNVRGASSNEP